MNCQPLRVVFVKGPVARAQLAACVNAGNVGKVNTAPVVAVLGHDLAFPERLVTLFAHKTDARSYYEGKPDVVASTALRNSSLHPVAMPALELSLLDADQQLVARRVIAVDPAVPAPPVLPARGQWNIDATVDVRLPPDLAQRDISGYRLTVFYP